MKKKLVLSGLTLILANCASTLDVKSVSDIPESSIKFYGHEKKPVLTPRGFTKLSTVESARKYAEEVYQNNDSTNNDYSLMFYPYDEIFTIDRPISCSESTYLIYGALEDNGMQPYFLLLANTSKKKGHITNIFKVKGKYGSSGANYQDHHAPTANNIPSLINKINQGYQKIGYQFTEYNIIRINPDHIKHQRKMINPLQYFKLKKIE